MKNLIDKIGDLSTEMASKSGQILEEYIKAYHFGLCLPLDQMELKVTLPFKQELWVQGKFVISVDWVYDAENYKYNLVVIDEVPEMWK